MINLAEQLSLIRNFNQRKITKILRGLVLTSLILVTGCDREELLKEVQEFNKTVNTGTDATEAYYLSLNEIELKLYFELLALNPDKEVGDDVKFTVDIDDGKQQEIVLDSPLKKPAFPLPAIQARIELLKALSDYSSALALMAGDDSPEQFEGNITALKDRLISLETSFNGLVSQKENPDSKAQKYLDPISQIIGFLGKIALQEIQFSAIQDAVFDAEEPVNTVLDAIAEDLDAYVKTYLDLAADDAYTTLIDYYNRNRLSLSQSQREALLDRILERKNTFDSVKLNKPSVIPRQLKQVHLALVNSVESGGNAADLAQLRAEIDHFENEVAKLQTGLVQITGDK